jgi:hypothetical protein
MKYIKYFFKSCKNKKKEDIDKDREFDEYIQKKINEYEDKSISISYSSTNLKTIFKSIDEFDKYIEKKIKIKNNKNFKI